MTLAGPCYHPLHIQYQLVMLQNWSGRVGPRCRISYRPLFFNIQSEWIAPVVITRERIYRLARWAADNNLSAKRVDLKKRVDPMLGFVWIFQLWPLDRVNQWLTFKVILILYNGIGTWRDLVDFISLNNIKYYECRRSTTRFLAPSQSSGIYVLPLYFFTWAVHPFANTRAI